ncbi:hypothetical protein [Cerasicoccus maritimus]|uniref:hypothetical protein n=1 Tax=Cerasicoccus maritimus TaxID=490089 RepID=UPI002852940A|nr:hypothetical protein [Cerasicoccus maritimus]
MKKFLKIILILAVLLIIVGVIAAVVVTRPGFQKSIFLSTMEGKVDKVEVGTLSAGTSKVSIQALEIEQAGALVKLGDLQLTYSLWDFVFAKEIRIDELVVSDLLVDTTKMKPSGDKGESSEPSIEGGAPKFGGIFENAEVPVKLYIGKVDVNGKALLPARQVDFKLSGGDIAPGQEGKLTLKGDLLDETPGAAAERLALHGEIKLNQTSEQKLNRISFDGDISASGGTLAQPASLAIALEADKKDATEVYQLSVSRDGQELAKLESTFTPASESLVGGVTANVDRAALTPFLMGADLPDFTLIMDEQFQLDGKAKKFDVVGTLQLDLRNLAQWKPELANVGGGTLKANLKSTLQTGQILLETLDAHFVTNSGRKLLALELKRKFTIKVVDGKPQLDGQSGELLTVDLQNLPVAWLNPFLKGTSLSGDEITAGMSITAQSESDINLVGTKPLQIGQLSVKQGEKPLLNRVDIAVLPQADLSGERLTVKLEDLSLASGGQQLVTGAIVADVQDTKTPADTTAVNISLNGNLAKLLEQPVLVPYAGFAGGNYSLAGTTTPQAGELGLNLTLVLSDLTLKQTFDQLSTASLSVVGAVDGADRMDLKGKLSVKGGSLVSDAALSAKVNRSDGKNQFDVELTGDMLSIDQLQLLAAGFKNPDIASDSEAQPEVVEQLAKPTGPDETAAWAGNDGTFDLTYGQVIYGKTTLKQFVGKLLINDQTLRITPLQAQINDAPVSAKAIIDFTAGVAKPYALDTSIDLQGLEVGTLTTKTGKAQDAGITGPFSFKGEAKGSAPTLGQLGDLVLFNLALKGGPGVVRTEGSAVGSAVSGIGAGLGLVTDITSAFGVTGVKNNPAVQQVNGMLAAISEEIVYDEISLEASRKENLNVNLDDFVLLSSKNNMKFKGAGKITYQEDVPMTEQPMVIAAQLWTKGNQLKLISDLKLAGSSTDKEGFVAGPQFQITGTLSDPDYYSSLASTILGNLPNIVTGLVGGAADSATNTLGVTDSNAQDSGTDQSTDQSQPQNKNQEAARAIGGLFQGLLNSQQKKDQQE